MRRSLLFICAAWFIGSTHANADTQTELDAYWQKLATTVREGNAAGYRALYHPDAVVVMVESGKSHTIDAMMEVWTPGFEATAAGKMQADVEERHGQRVIGEDTVWESGIFHYWTIDGNGERTDHYAWFESLFVKKNGKWLQIMELQRKTATQEKWDKLAK